MAKDGIYYIRGEGHWVKVLGDPVDNYNKDGKEWTLELAPDVDGEKLIKELGLTGRMKEPREGGAKRILFRQRATRRDGEANKPITVVGPDNQPWDQTKLIGNGTTIDVKFKFVDYGKGKHPGVYPQGVRVLKHVPYERQEFAPLNPDDEFFAKPLNDKVPDEEFRKDFGLDDDLDDDVV